MTNHAIKPDPRINSAIETASVFPEKRLIGKSIRSATRSISRPKAPRFRPLLQTGRRQVFATAYRLRRSSAARQFDKRPRRKLHGNSQRRFTPGESMTIAFFTERYGSFCSPYANLKTASTMPWVGLEKCVRRIVLTAFSRKILRCVDRGQTCSYAPMKRTARTAASGRKRKYEGRCIFRWDEGVIGARGVGR
jgi:hypothetical protein